MSLIEQLRTLVSDVLTNINLPEGLVNALTVVVMILFWLILGGVVTRIVRLLILRTKGFQDKSTKQGLTMRKLVNNLIKSIFYFWIALMILREIGIDVLPVLAGAGVLAFAVGFGAQELIKDIISGFFLILENTFTIGDHVTIEGHSGTVLEVGLRRTKLLNYLGEVITINNGDVRTVVNGSLNNSLAIIEFNIDFRKDISIFESQEFKDFVTNFASNQDDILDEGTPVIVTNLLGGKITLRVSFQTNNRKHIGIEREFRKELLKFTQKHNIDLEVPVVIEHDNLVK